MPDAKRGKKRGESGLKGRDKDAGDKKRQEDQAPLLGRLLGTRKRARPSK